MDMKRFFAMILAAALLVCLFAACNSKKTATQPSKPSASVPTETTPDPATPTPTPVTPTPVTPTPVTPTPGGALPLTEENLLGTWTADKGDALLQLIFTDDAGCAAVTCDPTGKPYHVVHYSYAASGDMISISHAVLSVVLYEWTGNITEEEDGTWLHLVQDGEKVDLKKTSNDTTIPEIDEPTPTPVTPTPVTPTPVTPTPVTPTPVTPTPVTPTPVTPTPVTPTPVTPTPVTPTPVTPTPSENFAFYLEDAEAAAGGEVTLNLKVRNSPGFAGFSVCVKYDTSKLTYVSSLRKANNVYGTTNAATPGYAHLMATIATTTNTLSDGLYYTITFKVNGSLSAGEKIPVELAIEGDLDTVYTYDRTTKQSTEIDCELYGCTITVK